MYVTWLIHVTHSCTWHDSYTWDMAHSNMTQRIQIHGVWAHYGVATVSRIDKITGLFGRIASLLQVSFAKETYNFIDPTNQSHPICDMLHSYLWHYSYPWLIHMWHDSYTWDMTHSNVARRRKTHEVRAHCVTCLIHFCDMTHTHKHYTFKCNLTRA